MSRIVVAMFVLLWSFSLPASAELGCEEFKYGSEEWWYCVSKGGPD